MSELIELNKLSHLHDGTNIIFCKTDFLKSEIYKISKSNQKTILITGNSDYGIDSNYFLELPENIIAWFAQNAIAHHPKLHPLPLGLENYQFSKRDNHGIGYERAKLKEKIILEQKEVSPSKKIYSNFKVDTNPNYRRLVKNYCVQANHIDWDEPNLSLEGFFSKLQDYEACVCPVGNGVDTHRLWEVLYFNRIPITIKVGNYKIYELYQQLPIVILDSVEDLLNSDLLHSEIEEKKRMDYDKNMLNISYWIDKIKKFEK